MLYRLYALLPVLALWAASTCAHPGEVHPPMTELEVAQHKKRVLQSRNCHAMIRRDLAYKRNVAQTHPSLAGRASACVTEPESVEGPYYIRDELVRNDLREQQLGVDLELNLQVIDLATCEPLAGAFVELWHANSLGYYSGFIEASGGGDSSGNSTSSANSTSTSESSFGDSTDMSAMPSGSMTMSGAPTAPSGSFSGGNGTDDLSTNGTDSSSAGGSGGGGLMTDDNSFLRGGNVTDSNGNITLWTKIPSYYTGRAAHIHLHVFENATANENGTLSSMSGSLLHTGQLFFEQDLVNATMALEAYQNSQQYTANVDDSIYSALIDADYNPYIWTEYIGSTLEDGVRGYMAIVVDTTASQTISDPYWATTFLSAATASADSTSVTASANSTSYTTSDHSAYSVAYSTASSNVRSSGSVTTGSVAEATESATSLLANDGVPSTTVWGAALSLLALPLMLI
ncbi:hypothetical protein FFLO_05980 [Filobasidium floriforme]|uniref:Intradiol ring-cleavage dioxygenases domain-containing protein n=1 Tax=Filobasidium floriforme TaxID=5210 RepID=A0A8K0JI54_9TREE|nr:hypothetical protein FFLO_05980 [Filobasidium floriforme]